jgi:DNA primase
VAAAARTEDDKSKNEPLYRVTDFAARWYHRNLMGKETGAVAQRYLKKRGIPEAMWETFQLGWAGEAWDQFYQAARRKSAPVEPMRQLKLVASSEKRTGYYDYFRKRLMFPIALLSGRVVAFGARTLDESVGPKYLNSIESPIYSKRRILYGVNHARTAIRSERAVILVEGYTDCISLHANGFCNAVASCGTAITQEHAGLLRRLSRDVILVPDADPAGIDSALAAGSVFLAAGLNVKVVALSDGMDPDSAVQQMGREGFAEKITGSLEYFEYLDYIMRGRAASPREKEAVVQRVSAGFGASPDRLRYEVLAQEAARVLGIDPESFPKWRTPRGVTEADRREQDPSPEVLKRTLLEKNLLRLMLQSGPEAAAAREKLDPDDFSQEPCRKLYKLLDLAWENHIDIRSKTFQQKAEAAGLEGLAAEISLIPIPPGDPDILLKDTVRRVKELQIRDELNVLSEKLKVLPEDSEEAIAVAKQFEMLKQALMEL